MTNTSRRTVLLGLAASATAASASVQAGTSSEDSELIRLGNELPEVSQTYLDARDKVRSINREYASQWPSAPESILGFGGPDIERRLNGTGIERQLSHERQPQTHYVQTPDQIADEQMRYEHELGLTSTGKWRRDWLEGRIERLKVALPDAQQYEAETTRIKRESGYVVANDEMIAARDDLATHIEFIMQCEPQTMEGVIIQSQALSAWGDVSTFWRITEPKAVDWPASLAQSILRLSTT